MRNKSSALRRIRSSVALILLLASAAVFQASPAAAATVGPYSLYGGFQSYKCIDDPHGTHDNNVTMIIYTCLGKAANQGWSAIDTDTINHRVWLQNAESKKCLTVQNNSTANNAAIVQFDCNLGDNEQWFMDFAFQDPNPPFAYYYNLRNSRSNKCVSVKNRGTANSTPLLQFDCNDGANQLWEF